MANSEKRQHTRFDSLNLLHYAIPGEGVPHEQGMGRTLNVSVTGILLETHQPMEVDQTVGLTIGLEEELVVIQGKTMHCKPAGSERYVTGIHFLEMPPEPLAVLIKYIELFESQ